MKLQFFKYPFRRITPGIILLAFNATFSIRIQPYKRLLTGQGLAFISPIIILITLIYPVSLSGKSTKTAAIKTAPVLARVHPRIIFHGSRKFSYIALTFDACEKAGSKEGYDKKIIDILVKSWTPATLFLGGKWMLSHKKETRYLSTIPFFELANHSYSHPDMRKLSKKQIKYELNKTQDVMYSLTGRQGTLFRAPFGFYNKRLVSTSASIGLSLIQWDVVSGDPDPNVTSAMIRRFVLRGVRNGSIIIMHMNRRGHNTHKALPVIIRELRKRGYRFVTVSKLLSLRSR